MLSIKQLSDEQILQKIRDATVNDSAAFELIDNSKL
jgi:hypothetical protein